MQIHIPDFVNLNFVTPDIVIIDFHIRDFILPFGRS